MAFLNSMGMTLDELKRDEHLVDDIVAYHTLVGYNIRKADILAVQDKFNGAVPVYTLARPWHVTVMHKDGKSLVKDAQGNVAHILRALEHDNHVVHVIDKVLFSGERRPSVAFILHTMYYPAADVPAWHSTPRHS